MISPISPLWESYVQCMVQPNVGNYQLLGDSIFCRMASNVLNQPSKTIDGRASLGYCVSGQRIKQLTKKIKNCEYALGRKVVILIGTNDVLKNSALTDMIRHYRNLLKLLRLRNVTQFILLTLPPVPKYSLMATHWQLLRGFNEFIMTLEDKDSRVKVVDILPIFIKQNSPLLEAPPVPQALFNADTAHGQPESPEETTPKRKLSAESSQIETPIKKQAVDLEETDESKLSPFCRYLNKVNRKEEEDGILSSDDDDVESFYHMQPRIDFSFCNKLKRTIRWTEAAGEQVNATTTANTTTTTSTAAAPAPSNTLSAFNSKLISWTDNFLKLDYFETVYSFNTKNQKMDMIHPNVNGLRRIKDMIHEAVVDADTSLDE